MVFLEKITTKYVEHEDRFSITAEAYDKSTIQIWVSQRLLLRLLPHMFEWLKKSEESAHTSNVISQELINEFAQQQAQNELRPQQPVKLKNKGTDARKISGNSWLVIKVDIKSSEQVIELTFGCGEKNSAQLLLNKLQARQWLIILHAEWIKSEWALNIWPVWLTKTTSEATLEIH